MFKIEDYLTPEELNGVQQPIQNNMQQLPQQEFVQQPTQQPMFSVDKYLTPEELGQQPMQQPAQQGTPTFSQGMKNVWNDVSGAFTSTVENAPQLVSGMVDSAKQNFGTAEGLKQTIPAALQGVGVGAVDFLPNLAGLGVDLVNSYYGYDKVNMPEEWRSPLRKFYEREAQTNPYAWKTDKAEFTKGLSQFLVPGATIAKGANAAKLANATKISNAQKLASTEKATRMANKLDDVQKAKYARQLDKIKQDYKSAQEILAEAEKSKGLGRKVLDETMFGAATGLTEGENLEERMQNALVGGAFGAGGRIAHAGISKGLKSKPMTSAGEKISEVTTKFLDNHEKLAKGAGFIDNAFNLNAAKGKAGKYSGLYRKASEQKNFLKTASQAEKDILELAQKMSDEEYKKAFNYLKKGSDDIENKSQEAKKMFDNKNNEQEIMEEIISPYGDGKKRNLFIGDREQMQGILKPRRNPKFKTTKIKSDEEILSALENKLAKAKTQKTKDKLSKQIDELKTTIEQKQKELSFDDKKTKGKDSVVYDTNEYKDYDFEDTEKSIEKYISKYEQSEAGVDNLNKDYIPEGFHETKNNIREQYGKEIVDEGVSDTWYDDMKKYNAKDYVHYDDTKRGLAFIKTYEKMKSTKSIADKAKVFEEHIKNTPEEYRNQEITNFSEQALKDIERYRYKSTEDSYDINKVKNLRQAKNMERAIFELTKNHYEKPTTKQKQSSYVYKKSDEIFDENIKGLLKNEYALKAYKNNGIEKSLANHLKYAKNPQKVYESLLRKVQSKDKELSDYNTKRLNEIAKNANDLLERSGKNTIKISNKRLELNEAIIDLENAVKEKNISQIESIISENNGFVKSSKKLTAKQNDIISDAYALTVKDFENRLNDFVKSEKFDYDGFKALEQEYKNKKKRIENTYKNFEDKEITSYNVDYGRRGYEGVEKFTKKGDTYNKQASGVQEQPYVKKFRELDDIFEKEAQRQTERQNIFEQGKKAKGDIKETIKDVPENNHIHFIDGLLEQNVKSSTIISTIDEFIKTGKHTGETTLSDNLKNFLKSKDGKVLTTFKPRQILKDILSLDNETSKVLNEILSRVDSKNNNIFAIVNDDFYGVGGVGGTLKDGSTYVKFLTDVSGKKSQRQLIRTAVHELIHNFARKYPDVAETMLGITKQDTINGFYANKRYREFLNSEEGAIYKKYINASKETLRHLNKRIQKTIDKGLELERKYKNVKEEIKAREFSEQVVKLFEDNYTKKDSKVKGVEHVRKENEPSRDRQSVARDDGRRRTNASDQRGEPRKTIENSERTETGRELVVEEQPNKTPQEKSSVDFKDETSIKKDIEEQIKETEKVEKTFDDFVEQIFGSWSKNYQEKTKNKSTKTKTKSKPKENLPDNIKTYTDYIKAVSKTTEDLLLKHKTMTPEMIKAALKKFGSEDGVYFKQFWDGVDDYAPSKTGLLGKKKIDGKAIHGNAAKTVVANAQRMINFQHAETVVEYLKQNFGEKVAKGKSHPEGYIPVNSDILWNALAFRKSNKWLETLSKGKNAMKEAFSEADYNEFKGLVDRAGKSDLYVPKEALEAILDGSGEDIAQYFNQYVKGKKVDSKYIAKLSGAFLDFTNNQFKKAVLSTGSFFMNNRIGNQIMLAAKADSLGDYVKSAYNAFRSKNNVPSEVMTSLLLESLENFGGKRKYTGWKDVDNLLNLMDGHLLEGKGTGLANACVGMPNKVYNKLVEKVMNLNERFERFERKQAYFQEISKAKKAGILKTSSKALTIEQLYKHIDDNPNLKEYIVDKVNDVLGDYNNFSNAEKKVFKRIIPFYSWHRTIFRHTLKLAKENPTRFGLIALKLYLINNREDGRPDWQRGALDNIFGIKLPKGYVINKKAVIPYATIGQDLTKVRGLIPGLAKDGGENAMGDINPALKTGYEALIGKKTFAPASEITDKNWKQVTYNKEKGYFNKKTGEFVKGTPMQVRAGYLGKAALKTVYPVLENPSLKGTTSFEEISKKGKLPDKMYDSSFGGYYNKEYIGKFNGKRKYRNAKMALPLEYQIANRVLGLGIQKDLKGEDKKLKRSQEKYNKKRKKK